MARASHVTLCIDVARLPALPGALELGRDGFKTRASQSNRQFLEPMMRVQSGVDADRLELAFDAQTSGGLLIAVPSARAEELVQRAAPGGATASTVIGEVVELQQGVSVMLRP